MVIIDMALTPSCRLALSANVLLASALAMAARCPATYGKQKEADGVSGAENKKASSVSPSDRPHDAATEGGILQVVTQKKPAKSRIRIRDGKPRNGMCVVCGENEVNENLCDGNCCGLVCIELYQKHQALQISKSETAKIKSKSKKSRKPRDGLCVMCKDYYYDDTLGVC